MKMTDFPVEQAVSFFEIAYQEYEVVSRDQPIEQIANFSELAVQEYEVVTKDMPILEEPNISGETVTGGVLWIKYVINIIRYAFAGKAFLFDGSSITAFPNTGVFAIYPSVAGTEDYIAFIGGLKEDNTIQNELLVYGQEVYRIEADRDYMALIIPGEEVVQVYDENGNIIKATKEITTVPLLKGWVVASRKQFVVSLLPI